MHLLFAFTVIASLSAADPSNPSDQHNVAPNPALVGRADLNNVNNGNWPLRQSIMENAEDTIQESGYSADRLADFQGNANHNPVITTAENTAYLNEPTSEGLFVAANRAPITQSSEVAQRPEINRGGSELATSLAQSGRSEVPQPEIMAKEHSFISKKLFQESIYFLFTAHIILTILALGFGIYQQSLIILNSTEVWKTLAQNIGLALIAALVTLVPLVSLLREAVLHLYRTAFTNGQFALDQLVRPGRAFVKVMITRVVKVLVQLVLSFFAGIAVRGWTTLKSAEWYLVFSVAVGVAWVISTIWIGLDAVQHERDIFRINRQMTLEMEGENVV